MKNCIAKIIDNVFEKNDEGELFHLIGRSGLACPVEIKPDKIRSK